VRSENTAYWEERAVGGGEEESQRTKEKQRAHKRRFFQIDEIGRTVVEREDEGRERGREAASLSPTRFNRLVERTKTRSRGARAFGSPQGWWNSEPDKAVSEASLVTKKKNARTGKNGNMRRTR